MIVATDTQGQVLTLREYKYAANETFLTLPAGQIDAGEAPEEAAARELLEETGYGGGSFEVVDALVEYPTKNLHKVTVVRAKNVSWHQATKREEAEMITSVTLYPTDVIRTQIRNKEWKIASTLAAMTMALPELGVQ